MITKEQADILSRDHPLFAFSFTFMGDERTDTVEYKKLMALANIGGELQLHFQIMVYGHAKEHQVPNKCLICLLAVLW